MQDLILVGAGGCMRELVWQIQVLNNVEPTWNIRGFVEYVKPDDEIFVGGQHIPYLGNDDVLINCETDINVAICIGSPNIRKKIVAKYSVNNHIKYPNLILSNAHVCEDVKMGQGCIISMDARISTNVQIGDFVFLNTGAMICHDGKLGDFVTLSPDVKLAGAVHIESGCEIGIGAKVIQGISIAENVIVGAGGIVVRDIKESCTAVGVPARAIK